MRSNSQIFTDNRSVHSHITFIKIHTAIYCRRTFSCVTMSIKRIFLKLKHILFKYVSIEDSKSSFKRVKTTKRFPKFLLAFVIAITLFGAFMLHWNNNPILVSRPFIYIEPFNSYFRHEHSSELKDWHDYAFIAMERNRTGPGERGTAVILTKEEEELSKPIIEEHHHNGFISDKISRERSVPDTRPVECQSRKYLADLPSTSVIIPFYNEILSTLTRTIHSVFNRSPPELLKEVILVNDHSDKDYCYGPLEEYLRDHFDMKKIKIIVMPVRSGLIWGRLAGARAATGDVLVFIDCHVEANVNWLPPLIDPIARNYRAVVSPIIEAIRALTYEYIRKTRGSRGAFNWHFTYIFLPLREQDRIDPAEPYETPIMLGGLFAISAKFFWELGGYDTGLEIWGGEQYELSFKVWLCGGVQYDTNCSRFGHIYRRRPFSQITEKSWYDRRNIKRVIETWMDDYKQYVYDRNPEKWNSIDAGDLTYVKAFREKLNCKPFKYFLEEIAPDLLERYPAIEPEPFASGMIKSEAYPNICIDTLGVNEGEAVGLYTCKNDKYRQSFQLRVNRDIRVDKTTPFMCLDVNNKKLTYYPCSFNQGSQYFRYDFETKQIICGGKSRNQCVEINKKEMKVFVTNCNKDLMTQKWTWDFMNETMLRDWGNYGHPIMDPEDLKEFTLSS
ncbi:CLUMA_CG017018, isoform A [Clunio marinus]|uniref:Polypeptide N-acetylgalactosaminyltransferase n=1 Tax=Clunio marinus TaxID=568069 RepID=A0A1J1IUW3_9DIPT|nr:CLUMA_CG017018, isoform A [Clunio marinus]